ncbi:hypothetical protein DFQ29_009938 [Apophysomyces sp. BC1021]|nr:hypothetical protein DFQ29_009938 [Apophysomyces sp. BC1021]
MAPDDTALMKRAIVTPRNDHVDYINDTTTKRFQGTTKEYLSADSIVDSEHPDEIPVDFLNSQPFPGAGEWVNLLTQFMCRERVT